MVAAPCLSLFLSHDIHSCRVEDRNDDVMVAVEGWCQPAVSRVPHCCSRLACARLGLALLPLPTAVQCDHLSFAASTAPHLNEVWAVLFNHLVGMKTYFAQERSLQLLPPPVIQCRGEPFSCYGRPRRLPDPIQAPRGLPDHRLRLLD